MYPTGLKEIQWQCMEKILLMQASKRKHNLKEIWNTIFYVVKTGYQWLMLPADYPKWQLVYYYFRKWSSQQEFDLLLGHLCERVRLKRGQNPSASLGLLDSQSVRWSHNRQLKSFDGNNNDKRNQAACGSR